jgi:hypothetical protein
LHLEYEPRVRVYREKGYHSLNTISSQLPLGAEIVQTKHSAK